MKKEKSKSKKSKKNKKGSKDQRSEIINDEKSKGDDSAEKTKGGKVESKRKTQKSILRKMYRNAVMLKKQINDH